MFVTFEGIEGTGKSTQIRLLARHLEERGRTVLVTREPGGSRIGAELRKVLLSLDNAEITGRAELFLYLADRAQHVAQVIKPALARGEVVLSDRFADSTVAYQGYGRGLDPDMLQSLNAMAMDGLSPDVTILLDIEPEQGLRRALARNLENGAARAEGRFEAEKLDFHQRVRGGYLALAARFPERMRVIDASGDADAVFTRVLAALPPGHA